VRITETHPTMFAIPAKINSLALLYQNFIVFIYMSTGFQA